MNIQSSIQQELGFCPKAGLHPGAASGFRHEIQCVLHTRLKIAALILFCGTFAFLMRAFFLVDSKKAYGESYSYVIVPFIGLVIFQGLIAISLASKWRPELKTLRWLEMATFGMPAAFFVWDQFHIVCQCHADDSMNVLAAFNQMTIAWLILLQIYGVFIPNTLRRASIMIGILSILPIVGAIAAAQKNVIVANMLYSGAFSARLFALAMAGVTAVYGSHRFGVLRRKAYDANQVGSYTLKKKLGSGGMGEVYLAEHRLLKRPCAIKLIREDLAEEQRLIARFENEVQATAKLTHPNTIEIYDYGHTENCTFYYAMEYLPGMDLNKMVKTHGPLSPARTIHLLRQVCSALREAHAAGLIHRDIKPGNIFASERGGLYDVAKLLDFGLVKSSGAYVDSLDVTNEGAIVGSPLFTSPEAFLEETPDGRSDIYALGTTAHFLLTGKPLFNDKNALKVVMAHVNDPPPHLRDIDPSLPADLEAVILKCLEKKREDRYADVAELERALSLCRDAGEWTQDDAATWWENHPEVAEGAAKVESDGNALDATVLINAPV